jgi:hypothetical protein
MGFGREMVSSLIRVPNPPARITAFNLLLRVAAYAIRAPIASQCFAPVKNLEKIVCGMLTTSIRRLAWYGT